MIRVALDGPAGAGKSSVARAVAEKLGFVYVDTGAMYRAVAVYAIENCVEITEENFTDSFLDKIHIDIEYDENGQKIILEGRDVSRRIREEDAGVGASDCARIPAVRIKLVALQRELARKKSVIMDGRDIGTYVLPDAEIKIFLTASIDVRAKRRYDEMREKGKDVDFEKIREDIAYRDKNDSEREFAPLKQADDAILLDTSDMNFEEVRDKMIGIIRGQM